MVVKGRVRDTAWFAITLNTWPGVKDALEAWLRPENFDGSGEQRMSLQVGGNYTFRQVSSHDRSPGAESVDAEGNILFD